MTGTLVDTNVLIDVSARDSAWHDWSMRSLRACIDAGRAIINSLIYAEASIAFARIEDLNKFLPENIYQREALPWPAAFMAGQAFVEYRRGGGVRTSPLADFYIGAHAAVM